MSCFNRHGKIYVANEGEINKALDLPLTCRTMPDVHAKVVSIGKLKLLPLFGAKLLPVLMTGASFFRSAYWYMSLLVFCVAAGERKHCRRNQQANPMMVLQGEQLTCRCNQQVNLMRFI